MHPDGLNVWYFRLNNIWSNRFNSLKNQRSSTSNCEDRGIRKFELVAKLKSLPFWFSSGDWGVVRENHNFIKIFKSSWFNIPRLCQIKRLINFFNLVPKLQAASAIISEILQMWKTFPLAVSTAIKWPSMEYLIK